jgi:purine nucleosidase
MGKKYNIILDTDVGDDIDDAIAIAYAAIHPRINLLGLTTVFWKPDKRRELVLTLLGKLGFDNIPCYSGFSAPIGLNKWNGDESWSYWGNQFPFIDDFAEKDILTEGKNAVEYIIQTVMNSTYPITLVGIAPATNIAEAIKLEPAIAKKVERFVLMGGNVNSLKKEYNLCSDIKAYEIIFNTDTPLTLAPWESTKELYDYDFQERLIATGKNGEILNKLYELWLPYKNDKPDAIHYDLATLTVLTHPELFTLETIKLSLESNTGLLKRNKNGKKVTYIKGIDISAFFDDFFEVIST